MNPLLKFPSFRSALDYHESCPVCTGPIELDGKSSDYERQKDEKIIFHFGDDVLTIDLVSDRINIEINEKRMIHLMYSVGCDTPYMNAGPSYGTTIPSSGTFMQGIGLSCSKCCQYAYTVQIVVDINEVKLAGVFLNSETLTIETGGIVHEIRNVYVLDKTEYTSFSKDGGTKVLDLPLIPLDLYHPQDTIERIRKLILFS